MISVPKAEDIAELQSLGKDIRAQIEDAALACAHEETVETFYLFNEKITIPLDRNFSPSARLIGPGDDFYGRDRYKVHFDRIVPTWWNYNPIYEACTE